MEENRLTALEKQNLLRQAEQARRNAYAPYSQFMVGAALLGESGRVYAGCNVENASYPAGICAERAAVAQAVSQGERRFKAIAIVGGNVQQQSGFAPAYPCGICRQVLQEFGGRQPLTVLTGSSSQWEEYTLSQLLPHSFGPEAL